jgi:hypothetical protein
MFPQTDALWIRKYGAGEFSDEGAQAGKSKRRIAELVRNSARD